MNGLRRSYDSLDAAYDWARQTLEAHSNDKREFLYTRWVGGRAGGRAGGRVDGQVASL